MSANVSSPCARSAATACSLVAPAGSCLPMKPVKITSVAQPRILGPMTLSTMPATASTIEKMITTRSGTRCPSSRFRDGPKLSDFSTAMAEPGGRGPAGGAYLGRTGALVKRGGLVVGAGHHVGRDEGLAGGGEVDEGIGDLVVGSTRVLAVGLAHAAASSALSWESTISA